MLENGHPLIALQIMDKSIAINQASNLIAIIFLILAFFIVCGNYFNGYTHRRNRRKNIPQPVSMIPLLAQIFAGIAFFMLVRSDQPWIPVWSPGLIGLADPAFWEVIYGLVRRK